jgi:hypothetical protein
MNSRNSGSLSPCSKVIPFGRLNPLSRFLPRHVDSLFRVEFDYELPANVSHVGDLLATRYRRNLPSSLSGSARARHDPRLRVFLEGFLDGHDLLGNGMDGLHVARFTRYEGILTRFPFTVTWPWETS